MNDNANKNQTASAVYELKREIPVEDGYDVIVAGGGPSGCAAAVSAARLGARVLLVEALGCLGGAGTSGLVTNMGELGRRGKMLLGGFMYELAETLRERGYLTGKNPSDRSETCYFEWQPFDSEGLKLVLDEFMEKAGVEVRFFTRVIDADCDPDTLHVNGVVLSNIEGYKFVKAKAYIDCTGDAVLAEKCGVEFDIPKPAMAPTLMATLYGVNWKEIEDSIDGGQIKDQRPIILKAVDNDEYPFTFKDKHIPGVFMGAGNTASLNAGHIFDMDALNCKSLSDGMVLGRKLVQEYLDFFKTFFKEYSNLQLVTTAPMMGVRDSRRIKGEYILDLEDYLDKRKFHDQICLNAQNMDLHVKNTSKEEYDRFSKEFFQTFTYGPGDYFGIPYGVLVPKGSQNLWVAGRIVSCDESVHSSIRMMSVCYTTGQAAGTAAVQAIRHNQTACDLDTKMLVETLRENGANLPQETLCETMSRK